ncbi:FAD-binding oxidoreductase [Streptomyces triticirhizae]|uniref:FAD-binding oxidoreductase n=1 Tax=Streptomyces triticirhizae TaxID=2483353 RepID=UPI001F41D1E9|nr:FAD-binding protein [Streptomyces triticirhizae]
MNQRWVATPEAVHLVGSARQAQHVVQAAVDAGKRLSVRSGGHCYGDFVCNPEIDVILDVSLMNEVFYDAERRAFCVEAGAQLGQIYEQLYRGWGVTLPGGACLTVGIGGHASGGGFGMLTRKYGLVADQIEAVEMVVVDASGQARTVVASRDPEDPAHDLCWAVSGGGGGSFGVITRFWFRSPQATGTDPSAQLPAPPPEVLIGLAEVPWSALDDAEFGSLMRNFADWHIANGSVDSRFIDLSGYLVLRQGPQGGVSLFTQVDGGNPNADQLLADYTAALIRDTGIPATIPTRRVSWLASTKLVGTSNQAMFYDHSLRSGTKSAFLRRGFTDEQLAVIHRHMVREDYNNPHAAISLNGGGGQHDAVDPAATPYPHRDTAFFALFESFWTAPGEDATHLGWQREVFRDTFADTGGYPVPNDQTDGCYFNDPDTDIMDPAYNASGVPWHALYFKDNYRRLQEVKSRWDPSDVFRHAQSVRPL